MTLLVIWGHFLGDFVFQTRSIANGKSKSIFALTFHVLVYSLCLFLATFWATDPEMAALFAVVNGVAHLAVDYFTSRKSKEFWDRCDGYCFFLLLGFDQALHMTVLALTLPLIR